MTRVLADDVFTASLTTAPVPSEDVLDGAPAAGSVALAGLGDIEVGVWEITAGEVRDTEVDEIFVVLSGSGSVRFEDGATVELGPGSAVRLREGERTEWTIRETLRKVYVALGR